MRVRVMTVVTACLLSVLGVVVTGSGVLAHPGGTASDGCHYCRTNCDKWGEAWDQRHCHGGGGGSGGGGTTSPPPPPPPPADTTPPDRPSASTGDLNGSTVVLRVSAEAGSTIQIVSDGSTLATATATGERQDVPVGLPGDGRWRLEVGAVDAAGNASPTQAVMVTVDTTAPSASIEVVPPTGEEARTQVLVVGESGAAWELVAAGPSTLTERGRLSGDEEAVWLELPSGDWSLALTVTDSAGNAATAEEAAAVDVPAPERPELEIVDVNEGTLVVRLTGTPGSDVVVLDQSGTELATATLDEDGVAELEIELPEGRHELSATATNFAGMRSDASAPHDLAMDWTPPTVRIVSAVGRPDGSVVVDVEIDDPEARVWIDDVERVGSGQLVLEGVASGEHEFQLAAVDAAGNEFEDRVAVLVPEDDNPLAGVLALAVLGAGGFGAWRWWRRRAVAAASPGNGPPPPSGPPTTGPPPPPAG